MKEDGCRTGRDAWLGTILFFASLAGLVGLLSLMITIPFVFIPIFVIGGGLIVFWIMYWRYYHASKDN